MPTTSIPRNNHFKSMQRQHMDPIALIRDRFRIRNRFTVNLLSELFSTFILMFIGTGITMQTVLSGGELNSSLHNLLAWCLLVTICVYSTLMTSGCHMNPAFTIVLSMLGRTPCQYIVPYISMQMIGALLGLGCCYNLYRDTFLKFTGGELTVFGSNSTAQIFTTFPAEHIANQTAFMESIIATGFLTIVVLVVTEPRNRVPQWMLPPMVGVGVFVASSSFGLQAGGVLNPAANLAGRVFCWYIGYGWEVFSWHGYYCWIPVVAPCVGAIVGAWFYVFLVQIHIPDTDIGIRENDEDQRRRLSSSISSVFSTTSKQHHNDRQHHRDEDEDHRRPLIKLPLPKPSSIVNDDGSSLHSLDRFDPKKGRDLGHIGFDEP